MFSKGDELYDKRFGERYQVLEAAQDSGGELVKIQDTAAPGPSRRPVSAHPAQRERFEVLSGTLGLTVDGEQHLLGPGESFWWSPARGIYRATSATASCGSSPRCFQRAVRGVPRRDHRGQQHRT